MEEVGERGGSVSIIYDYGKGFVRDYKMTKR